MARSLTYQNRLKSATNTYRKLACMNDDDVITNENLDEQALNNTARMYSYGSNRLRADLIGENVVRPNKAILEEERQRQKVTSVDIYRNGKKVKTVNSLKIAAEELGIDYPQIHYLAKKSVASAGVINSKDGSFGIRAFTDGTSSAPTGGSSASVSVPPVKEVAQGVQEENPELSDEQATGAAEQAVEVAKKTDADVVYVEGEIEKKLDKCFKTSLRAIKRGSDDKFYSNLCIVGDVGTGKTARVSAWVQHQNKANGQDLKLVLYNASELTIDEIKSVPVGEDPDDPGYIKTAATRFFQPLISGNQKVIMYIDEYNRCPPDARAFWFKLIDEHNIPDPNTETRQRFLPNLLFTVITINPYFIPSEDGQELEADDTEGVTPLLKPERNRFRRVDVVNDNDYMLKYLTKYFEADSKRNPEDAEENAGRLKIATVLLSSPEFFFSSTREINKAANEQDDNFLTSRSLKLALQDCDGTVEDFLDSARDFIGKEKTQMCADILRDADLEDTADDSNALFNKDEDDQPMFNKGLDIRKGLSQFGNLGF